jgi:DNA replication ATP-dependent helicase Dna2
MRKAVLQERVRATGDISKPMAYGNILHAVFQAGLEDNDFSTPNLYNHIDRIIIDELESLFLLQEEIEVATEYVRSKVPIIQEWSTTFITQKKPNVCPSILTLLSHPATNISQGKAAIADHNNRGSNPLVAINKLLEVEEHIWSPSYGLKGNIDATVQATVIENKGKGINFGNSKTLTIPLEFKTGKAQSIAHRAQTMLYTLLMSDRYDINVTMGLLYYMEGNEMIRITGIQAELRELILKRNEVASYIAARQTLPDMLGDEHACTRCYAKTSCFMYHKLYEGGTPETSGAPSVFPEITEHLNETHAAFFKHWDTLLTYEEKGSTQFRSELWTMTSEEREAAGRAFSNLIIVPEASNSTPSTQKINKYRYTFKKADPSSNWSFQDSQLGEGDPIVISDEKGHIALSIGFVTEIRRSRITIQGDRRLHNTRTRQHNFDEDKNQVFNGIIELRNGSRLSASEEQEEPILYRLDKDEFSSGMSNIRNNLIQLMSPSSPSKYLQLIVDLIPPIFKPHSTAYHLPPDLNPDQHRAVEKVMSAKDYALVLGMPGTGKTTTIAHIIRALVAQGKSVLLTSYTHTAVDNILLKLRPLGLNILRLGVRSKIHPTVPTFCSLSDTRHTSFSTLRETLSSPQIVATTCLSISYPIFQLRKFDYCLIDEASQITLPICIGPIRMAETFVLVGDHYQLPPLVKNAEAREGGMDVSLFKLLSEAHPDAVTNLEIQYRMCEEIMTLSNELIYGGRLKCGTREVAERALKLPTPGGLEELLKGDRCGGRCWIRALFEEKVKAVFVDTDQVPAREVKVGDRTINPVEAALTAQLIEGFLSSGVPAGEIGVITVYRSQLKTIQQLLSHAKEVEMHTADKFQGRDKEVIVISLVRSNDEGNIGELLRDWRRINVAFTRARSKLIILGSRKTLGGNELLKGFLGLMEGRGWVYQLPKGAEKCHPGIEEGMKGESPRKTQGRRSPKKITGKLPGGLRGRVLRDIRNEF